jgi:hypothetical protein
VAKQGAVRKTLRLTQEKLDRAKKILGTTTDTETVESALDLVVFRDEVAPSSSASFRRRSGIARIADTNDSGLHGWLGLETTRSTSRPRICNSAIIWPTDFVRFAGSRRR